MRLSTKRRLLPVLFAFLALAGCDRSDSSPTSPAPPQRLLGGLLGGTSDPAGWTIDDDPLVPSLLNNALSVVKVIGPEGGSLSLSLLGHRVDVPAGAVSQPTTFSMLQLSTAKVRVDLSATIVSRLLGIQNIGEKGFDRPVRVTFSYARSTNVPDPTKLVVLRLNGPNGLPEPLPTQVDTTQKTISAELDHFSQYAAAFPN